MGAVSRVVKMSPTEIMEVLPYAQGRAFEVLALESAGIRCYRVGGSNGWGEQFRKATGG